MRRQTDANVGHEQRPSWRPFLNHVHHVAAEQDREVSAVVRHHHTSLPSACVRAAAAALGARIRCWRPYGSTRVRTLVIGVVRYEVGRHQRVE